MQSINKLLKDTIEIEKETYILKENFYIQEDIVDVIRKFIISKINEKGYLALKMIDDYSMIPTIKYQWNAYLLRDICKMYIPEVKELKKQFYDKRYSAPVIVMKDCIMNGLLDLILQILNDKFYEGVSLNKFTKYLRNKKVIHDKIPVEIFYSDEVSIEDNYIKLNKK